MKPTRLFAFATLLSLAAPLASQNSVLPFLPKDTIVAVSAPDLTTSLAEFQRMPLAKMWAEEETQKFLADVIELGKKKFAQGLEQARQMHAQGKLPVDPDEILKLRVHGGTFAITHLEMKAGDFGPMPKIGMIAHLDFGPTAQQWHSLVALGLSMLQNAAGAELAQSESKAGEWQIRSLVPNGLEASGMGLHIAMVPNGLLIGTLLDEVTAVAESMQKQTAILGASETFAAAAKQIDISGAEVQTFVRMDPIVDFLLQGLQVGTAMNPQLARIDMAGVERAVQALGLRKLGVEIGTSHYVDGKAVERNVHLEDASHKTTTAPKLIDTSLLKWVPKDAVSFASATFDIASIYDRMVKALEAYDPEVAKNALGMLAEHEKQLGFKVREDLFGSIGDHYIRWSMAIGSISSAPEVAFLLKVNDEAKLVSSLQNLAKISNGIVDLEESDRRGLKTWQVHVNFDPTHGMSGFNVFDVLRPTFAFKNGYLVGGFSAADIKRVLQRMDREDDPKNDIRSNKEYAAIASTIPTGVTSLSFTDWKSQFESFYQIATGLLQLVPIGEEVPIDMSLLPDSATLTKHLFGAVSYSKTDGMKSESVSVGPFGMEVAVIGVAVAAGVGATIGVMNARRF